MKYFSLSIFIILVSNSILFSQLVVEQITDFGGNKDGVKQYELNIVSTDGFLFFPSFTNVNGAYPSKPYLTKYNLLTKQFELPIFNNKPIREPYPMFQLQNGITAFWAKPGDSGSARNLYTLNSQGTNPSIINDQLINTPLCGSVIDDKLYFGSATNLPDEFWVSDGTVSGTYTLKDKDLNPIDFPCGFTKLGNNVVFSAKTTLGQELYITDGIKSENTRLIKDIHPNNTLNGVVGGMMSYESKAYFLGDNQVNGREVWVTDGSTENTKLLKDINPGAASSNPRLIPTKESLIILAESPTLGIQFWSSNSTSLETNVTSNFTGNQNNFTTYWVEELDSILVLAIKIDVGFELYKYSKKTKKLELIQDINPGDANGVGSSNYIKHKNVIYFIGNDPIKGYELWRTDGSINGTYLINDLDPSIGSFSSIEFVRVIDDKLYFSQAITSSGRELYSFDTKQQISSVFEENIQDTYFELFPNPTTGTIHSKWFKGLSSVQICSVTGQKSRIMVVDETIDISEFNSGIYYLLIKTNNNISSFKILKI